MANKLANKSNVSLFARFYVFYQHLYLRWAIFLSNTGVGEKGGGVVIHVPISSVFKNRLYFCSQLWTQWSGKT